MRKFAIVLIGICSAALYAFNASAQPLNIQAVEELVTTFGESNDPGISVAISVDGEVVYDGFVGQADLSSGTPIDADTKFPIASVSKQFTAFAIMLLADEGALTLDQNIRDIIPELEAKAVPVTIRHLLNHTSGLREANSLLLLTGQSESSPVTQQQSLDLIFRQQGGNFEAGERQEYSNTGYQLLAEIVSRVSGKPFPEFLQEKVFEPLGMANTSVHSEIGRVIDNLAVGYRPQGQGFFHTGSLSATYGSTGMISTPRDLLLWGDALNKGALGEASVMAAMAERSVLGDGRRLIATNGQEYRRFQGVDTWSHGGSAGGFRSFLLRIPSEQMSIAVIGNRSDFLKAAFAFDVASAALGDRLEPAASSDFVPEAGVELDRYVGDYRFFAGVIFSLRRVGDQLTFSTFGSEQAGPLPQIGRGKFMLDPNREISLEFHDFEDGRATQMRWQVSEDGFIPAPRIEMEPVPSTPLKPDDFIGRFYSDSLQQVVSLYEDEQQLWLRTGDARRVQLERYQPDTFRPVSGSAVQKLEFTRSRSGQVTGVLVSTSLADDILFQKLRSD